MRSIIRQVRSFLLVAAVLAVGLVWLLGCADSGVNSGGGGGNIVGDWLMHSITSNDTTLILDRMPIRMVESFKSSGEWSWTRFTKYDDVWEEGSSAPSTWRTTGSSLYRGEGGVALWYNVSGSKLTVKSSWSDGSDAIYTYTKVNLANYRRSLGL